MPVTAADALELPPGRELDKLVAERVMGQRWQGGNPIPNHDGRWPWPAPYSTDIAAAWVVVEHPRKVRGATWGLLCERAGDRPSGHFRFSISLLGPGGPFALYAETAPLAICRAALLAC